MRNDPPVYVIANEIPNKEPRYTIEIARNLSSTEFFYITSHEDSTTPDGSDTIPGVVETRGISSTSQQLNPDEGRATIGRLTIRAVDVGGELTEEFHELDSLRGRRVRVYMGYALQDGGLTAWEDYTLAQTQIIDSVKFDRGAYVLQCSDVQRSARNDIFDLAETTLAQSISLGDTVVEVYDTSKFQMLSHGPSYSDAPNQTVGYFKIGDMVVRYTGMTSTSFTGCTLGVLGTKAEAIEIDDETDPERREKVEEFVYIELPGPKIAYALLTGSLYGEGKSIPSGWHLGMSGQYVRTSDFVNIGNDWWDPNDDERGRILRFEGLKKTDAKKFLEQEIYLLLGAYSPVHSNGELGLRRMSSILADAPHVVYLDERHIVSHSDLTYDMGAIHNQIVIRWNWSDTRENYTRTNALVDAESISKHGAAPVKTMEFRGLHGSRHTYNTLVQLFDSYRDRYSGPPLRMSITLQMRHNAIEIGDIVRVSLSNVRDHVTGQSLNRSFEVQSVRTDWIQGRVTLNLFGSSHPASLAPVSAGSGTAIDDSLYSSAGVNIETLPGVIKTGDVIRITQDLNLLSHGIGSDDIRSSSAIVYALGDLQLDAGVKLTVSKNTQIRHLGHFTISGEIDGVGNGNEGAIPYTYQEWKDGVVFGGDEYRNRGYNIGIPGGFGTTKPGGYWVVYWGLNSSVEGPPLPGVLSQVPSYDIDENLNGLPSDLSGTSGSSGPWFELFGNPENSAQGGAGGNGGAGLLLVGRGVSIEGSGKIDLSGTDGTIGDDALINQLGQFGRYSGAGAGGAPGGLLIVRDGTANTVTGLTSHIAYLGDSPIVEDAEIVWPGETVQAGKIVQPPPGYQRQSMSQSARRVITLSPAQSAQPDIPNIAPDPISLTVEEHINTPFGPNASISSLEVTVTPPTPKNGYYYANIYIREPGKAWALSGPAMDEWVINVPADGKSYEIQARAVSINGNVASSGPVVSVTVQGKTAPPANVTGFQLQALGGIARLRWNLHPDADVRAGGQILIRHTSRTIGADWAEAVPIGSAVPGNAASTEVPLLHGTYMAKAQDFGGRVSVSEARAISTVANIIKLNVVEILREDPEFYGVKTNLHGTFGGIALTGNNGLDEGEDGETIYVGGVIDNGLYEFYNSIDLGEHFICRVSGRLEAFTFLVDDWTDNYGCSMEDGGLDVCGPVDSETDEAGAVIEMQIDDGGWGPFYLGDFNGRKFEWRVRLHSLNPSVNVLVREIETEVDMPDRVEGDDDIIVNGTLNISFVPPFRNIPALAVTIDDAEQGDYFTVTNKTENGATITIFDESHSLALRRIDWVAKGYGRALNG